MSNIADGIEYALQQARAARAQTKTAHIHEPTVFAPLEVGTVGAEIKQAALVVLATQAEDVTVSDLQALMRAFR